MLHALLLLFAMCVLHINAMDNEFFDCVNEPEENFEMKQLPNTMWDEKFKFMWVKYFPKSRTWDNEELVYGKIEIGYDESHLRAGESLFAYEGALKDYLPHGDGILTVYDYPPFFEFTWYEGTFWKGQFHGKGKLINENKKVAFEGEFKDNYPHRGNIFYDDGEIYDGEIEEHGDLPHGNGKLMNKDGETTFKGTWFQGVKDHGKLRFYHPNGTRTYQGQLLNDEPTKGTLKDENNVKIYEGEVNKDFEPDGKGIIRVPGTDQKIRGIFKHGQLRMMMIGEQRYVGDTVDFKPHGEGCLYDKEKDILWQGTFLHGEKLEGEQKEPCSICSCHMFPHQDARTAGLPTRCTHTFHLACIKTWLETKSEYCDDTNKRCPMCRVYIAEYDHLNNN